MMPADPIESLFATRVLPRVARLESSEISCRVAIPGVGQWQLGTSPARSEIEIDGDALLTLRSTDARDTATFLREGRLKLNGDAFHALQVVAFLSQGDLFFGPQIAFNTHGRVRVSTFSVFAASDGGLSERFSGWSERRRLEEPREVTVKNPFTGEQSRRLTYDPPDGEAAFYVPYEPPFPFVELPIEYHHRAELICLYGRIMGWPQDRFPDSEEEVDERYEQLFPLVRWSSGDGVHMLALDKAFPERIASMTAEDWAATVPALGSGSPSTEEALRRLVDPLAELARKARQRREGLWLFGRV